MIIGVVGPISSGKSMLSHMLVQKGFTRFSFSNEVREEARKQGIQIARGPLQDLGNKMRQKHGNDYWAKRIIDKMESGNNYVVEGIRNPGEIDALRRLHNFTLVGVDAPVETRFGWMMDRGKDSDPKTVEDVKKIDSRDLGEGEPENGQQVGKAFEMSDIRIMNDGSKEDLMRKIEKVLKELGVD